VLYEPSIKKDIENNLLLFYLKSKRDASKILESQQRETHNKMNELRSLKNLVKPLKEIFSSGDNLNNFGKILDKSWEIKSQITDDISSTEIERYYQKAKKNGAVGGKLLGAGGGGFLLFYVKQVNQKMIIEALSDLYCLPVGFDNGGTRITYYDQPSL